MIHDVTLRWIVTALFVFSAVVCLRAIATERHSVAGTVSHTLHAVMAIAMAVMAWPRGADLPSRPPMLFFLAAAVWFAVLTVRTGGQGRGRGLANGYHTAMMLAMAWMYAAMGGLPLPTAASDSMTAESGHAGHGGHGGHSGHAGHADMAAPAPSLDWVAALNWACALGFGAAAAFWLYRLITARIAPRGTPDPTLGIACQLAMAAGMGVMFAVML